MKKLFFNGKIYDENFNINKNLLVDNGKIIYIGDEDIVLQEKYEKINLKKSYSTPGFFDSHLHLYLYSKSLFELNLSNIDNFNDLIIKLRDYKIKDNIIYGFGWDDEKWRVKPNKKFLDKIFKDRYVILKRRDGHSVWVNSKVLNEINIDEISKIKGSKVEKDENGDLTGILRERASDYVIEHFKEKQNIDEILKEGIKKIQSYGITAICNMDGDILTHLIKNKFNLRIMNSIPLNKLKEAISIGIRSGFGNNFLKICGLKIFMDGSLGSKTAYMKESFEDEKNNFGVKYFDEKELDEIVNEANKNGIYVWIHSIGDRANEIVLKIITKKGRNKLNRIEHSQIVSENFLNILKNKKTFLSVQPSHIILDIDKIETFLGKRGKYTYPFKSLIQNGATLIFGSDAPIENPDPLRGINVAVNREISGKEFFKSEAIDIKEAFKSYTINPAKSVEMENNIGSLSVGKFADFVTFTDDPLSFKGELISTYIEGEKVFKKD
ncbi:MAG TPA: amidohydrolase [Caldisericia bacterium]|nr:amidohydrolase [Caldisericia bacterium]HOL83188.1 amidohydrolase [Caldisericia bacterium]HPP43800.1 amidohydrolase [Caldisericia bacterium]